MTIKPQNTWLSCSPSAEDAFCSVSTCAATPLADVYGRTRTEPDETVTETETSEDHSDGGSVSAGLMLMFRWKTLPGSYSALIRASRSYFVPYAARTRWSSCSVIPLM